eukprot:m.935849 g.935849  ORF g.935849 m.935849 type:complete len:158 (+) comp215096_c0_seq1:14-487(+)
MPETLEWPLDAALLRLTYEKFVRERAKLEAVKAAAETAEAAAEIAKAAAEIAEAAANITKAAAEIAEAAAEIVKTKAVTAVAESEIVKTKAATAEEELQALKMSLRVVKAKLQAELAKHQATQMTWTGVQPAGATAELMSQRGSQAAEEADVCTLPE